MAINYVTTKPLTINGKNLGAGKIIVGVKKQKLEQLVRTGKAIKINTEVSRFEAVKELTVSGLKIMPGEEVTGLSDKKLSTLLHFRKIKEMTIEDTEKPKITLLKDIPDEAPEEEIRQVNEEVIEEEGKHKKKAPAKETDPKEEEVGD